MDINDYFSKVGFNSTRRNISLIILFTLFSAKTAYSQTQNICANSPIPSGWVVVSRAGTCGKIGNSSIPALKIKRIDGMKTGSVVSICGNSPVPSGWVVVSRAGTCGKIGNSSIPALKIKRIDGMKTGSVVSICGNSPVPSGWVVVSRAGTCGKIGNSSIPALKIKKVQ